MHEHEEGEVSGAKRQVSFSKRKKKATRLPKVTRYTPMWLLPRCCAAEYACQNQ